MPLKTNALIVTSKSNEGNMKRIAMLYKQVYVYTPRGPLTAKTITKINEYKRRFKNYEVVAIGGGTVIDIAKILAYPNRCIAFPTTAAGSAETATATVWGTRKETLTLKRPVAIGMLMPALLPEGMVVETSYDCLSHAVESLWSCKATKESKEWARAAINMMSLVKGNDNQSHANLVVAGSWAGLAINITSTNIIHALSYPITTRYKWAHGAACALWFWGVVNYFECAAKYRLPKLEVPEGLSKLIPKLDIDFIIREALTYSKIQDGPQEVDEDDLKNIWELCHEWTKEAR